MKKWTLLGGILIAVLLVLDNTITLKVGVNAPAGIHRVVYTLGGKTVVTAINDGYVYIPVKAAEMMDEIVLSLHDGVSATDDAELKISAVYYLTVATSDDADMNALFDAIASYAVYASEKVN